MTSSNTNSNTQLATYTTVGPCEYHRGCSIYIPGLSLTHDGGKLLYQPSDLSLIHGSITGLIGLNGSGKSSTAQLLASGSLENFPQEDNSNFVVEYLVAGDDSESLVSLSSSSTSSQQQLCPKEFIKARLEERLENVRRGIVQLDQKFASAADNDTTLFDNADLVLEQIADELSTLYDIEEQIETRMKQELELACIAVGLNDDKYRNTPLSELSCGWRYKCQLIASMLCHPDLLLLDEPSFLDESSMQWFIASVKKMATVDNCIVVLISHKEALLQSTCDRIVHLNSRNQTLTQYPCGYAQFKNRYAIELSNASNEVESTHYQMDKADKQLKTMKRKLQKNGTALRRKYGTLNTNNAGKETKTHVHSGMAGLRIERAQQKDKAAASKLRRAQQKMNEVEERNTVLKSTTKHTSPALHITGIEATESTVVQLQNVSFKYHHDDDYIFENIDTCIESTDRILLKGPNGVGKSTLVELILGTNANMKEPTKGVIKRNTNNILYFPQTALRDLLRTHGHKNGIEFLLDDRNHNDNDNSSMIVMNSNNKENCHRTGAIKTETQIRIHLGRFGLMNNLAVRPISTLSAGQRVRLWLAKQTLLKPKPSLLILDELSENVDIETRNSLVKLIGSFHGSVLVISHDTDLCQLLLQQSNTSNNSSVSTSSATAINKVWTMGQSGIHVSYPC